MNWQPLETAPRDATKILVWHKLWKCPVAVRWYETPTFGLGWYEVTLQSVWPDHAITHWMPLPNPPNTNQ